MFGFVNSQNIINISIDQNNICCAAFENKNKLLNLKAYKRHLIKDFEIYDLNLFNPIRFNNILRSFVKSFKIKDPVFNLSLSGSQITNQIILFDTMPKGFDEFGLQPQKMFWSLYQLNDYNQYKFFVTGINHSLMFQYKIFSCNFGINLIKITTADCALMKLINYDVNFQLNQMEYKISQLNLQDYVYTNLDVDLASEKSFIFKNLGLFLL